MNCAIADWLSDRERSAALAGFAVRLLPQSLGAMEQSGLRDFLGRRLLAELERVRLAPLAAGIVDIFRAKGLRIFGPTQAAAQLESSKDFAKAFMSRHGIPTADYQTFSDADLAHAWVNERGAPIVVKADGLAAGKGVVVAQTLAEAHAAIDAMLVDNRMGDAGARVVIEELDRKSTRLNSSHT